MSFHPKDDLNFQDRSPNDWQSHPNTVRLHHAHKVATTQLKIVTAQLKSALEKIDELTKQAGGPPSPTT